MTPNDCAVVIPEPALPPPSPCPASPNSENPLLLVLFAGYGSQDRYEGGVMISRFKDDASLSIIGSANNTNNKGFLYLHCWQQVLLIQ